MNIRPAASVPDAFRSTLAYHGLPPLTRAPLAQLQVNLGRLCNQACHHCHVDAGPRRTEVMGWETMERIPAWTRRSGIVSVDWLGRVYDCDFNQMLDLPLSGHPHRHLWEVNAAQLGGRAIAVGPHCLGCTAGCGSSCSGALAESKSPETLTP
jgi:MoaA/NifB/PqqE/SkfB family radical SAM enzyme